MTDNLEFERVVKDMLQSQAVDADTQRRLDAARQAAVASARSQRWQPLAAAASLAVAALIAAFLLIPDNTRTPLTDGVEDIEMLLADDNIELFEEMEFYQWLSVAGDAS